jgi:hypothetical protein
MGQVRQSRLEDEAETMRKERRRSHGDEDGENEEKMGREGTMKMNARVREGERIGDL